MINDGLQRRTLIQPRRKAGLVHAKLPVGAAAIAGDYSGVLNRLAATKLVDNIVEKVDKLVHEVGERDLLLFAEVDQAAGDAVAHRSPLVLPHEVPAVDAPHNVLLAQLHQLGDERLEQRGNAD